MNLKVLEQTNEVYGKLLEHKQTVEAQHDAAVDEATTTSYLVDPLVEDVLGYRRKDSRDVRPQFNVSAPGKNDFVDLVLLKDGTPVVMIEVKKRGTHLDDHVNQLKYYFKWVKSAKFAALTNGIEWRWYRGGSDIVNADDMEDAPFMKHNALDPKMAECPWLQGVSKAQFDADSLSRLSREIEFTARLIDWIDSALAEGAPGSAMQIAELARLGATEGELPIVQRSIRTAWLQMIDRYAVEAGLTRETADAEVKSDGTEIAPSARDDSDSTETDDRRIGSSLRVQFKELRDDQLVLDNGKTLEASKNRRAWRVAGGKWKVETSGIQVTASVLGLLLENDARRKDESTLAGLHNDIHHSQTTLAWARKIPRSSNLYFNPWINNEERARVAKAVADGLQFDPPDGSPLAADPTIEVWLVNKK